MQRGLNQLAADTYDVLIIGGGIYGVCAAWDAALRGLSVALVDKGDFGHATSSNSLRVIHGGLRYLQHGDFRRLRQSIQERTVFMRIAPHLVHPLPFLIPTYGHAMRGKEILTVALLVNDLIGLDRNRLEDPHKYLPPGRLISREECLLLVPGIEKKGLTGGAIVYDCQVLSSERLILSFVRSAIRAGAQAANYVEVFGLLRKGHRVAGVKARDLLHGSEMDIRARIVINASGPWLDRVLSLCNGHSPKRRLALSKAFNILVNRQLIPHYAVGIYAKNRFKDGDVLLSKGSRLLFLTPWHNRSLIGTVHLPYDCDPDHCEVTEDEIHGFLDEINEAYPAAALERQDVCLTYGGLLPIDNHGTGVQLLKRYRIVDHKKEEGIEGLVSVMGVKLTEARHVAEKTIDLVFAKLGETPPKSATTKTPLHGGQIPQLSAFLTEQLQRKPQHVSADAFQRLVQFYGSAYPDVLKYLDESFILSSTKTVTCRSENGHSPSRSEGRQSVENLSSPNDTSTAGNSSLIRAEILHSIREEMAQKLTDVVFRRTSLGIVGNQRGDVLRNTAAIMAKELGWNGVTTQREINEAKTFLSARTQSG
jgi:glycerol-3-phosphate dehydrogenase